MKFGSLLLLCIGLAYGNTSIPQAPPIVPAAGGGGVPLTQNNLKPITFPDHAPGEIEGQVAYRTYQMDQRRKWFGKGKQFNIYDKNGGLMLKLKSSFFALTSHQQLLDLDGHEFARTSANGLLWQWKLVVNQDGQEIEGRLEWIKPMNFRLTWNGLVLHIRRTLMDLKFTYGDTIVCNAHRGIEAQRFRILPGRKHSDWTINIPETSPVPDSLILIAIASIDNGNTGGGFDI